MCMYTCMYMPVFCMHVCIELFSYNNNSQLQCTLFYLQVTAMETENQQLTEQFEQVRLELEKLKKTSSKADSKAAKV